MIRGILLALFVIVLVAPMLISQLIGKEQKVRTSDELELIVITAHQEGIRREFADAFSRWHREKYGQSVIVSYLTFGGTDMVKRFDEQSKTSPGNYGIDIAWGGGDYLFEVQLKKPGYLAPLKLDDAFLAAVYPSKTLGGLPLYDLDEKNGPAWFGTALSSFGIVYNRDLLRYLGMPEPKTWRDLADPRLMRWIALADPTRSASAKQTYMVIVERAMANASARGESEDSGWADGMGLIRQISANARFFTDSSSVVPIAVSQGEAAAGMAIDFFGRSQADAIGGDRLGYVEPENATIINPDPIAMVAGAPHPELAERFIRFVLSHEGQRIWNLRAGSPGGPISSSLRRLPIRRDVYEDMTNFTDPVNPFVAASSFNKSNAREATFPILGDLIQASCIDLLDELQLTREMILKSSYVDQLDAHLGRFPFDQREALRMQTLLYPPKPKPGQEPAKKLTVAERLALQRRWSLNFRNEYQRMRTQAAMGGNARLIPYPWIDTFRESIARAASAPAISQPTTRPLAK